MADNIKDTEYLGKLQDYYAKWRSLPSYNRLCDVFGLASRSAVSKVLGRLAKEGYLTRTPDNIWVPARRFFERHLSEFQVPAGSPVIVGTPGGEAFFMDEYLIDYPSRTSFIPVRGNSMTGAGIHDGDMAVVERKTTANKGDIVVAVVDGELTLKRLDQQNGSYVLKPENPDFPVIYPRGALEIFGVMVGLARKIKR